MSDRLFRSREDRMLAGVAGGLAEMWDADPALIRVIWALLVVFTGGIALLVYIVMAIVVPEDDGSYRATAAPTGAAPTKATFAGEGSEGSTPFGESTPAATSGWVSPSPTARAEARAARRAARAERGGGMSVGVVLGGFLVLLGLFFLVRQYLPHIDFDWFWPLILVGLGVALVVSATRRGPRSGGSE